MREEGGDGKKCGAEQKHSLSLCHTIPGRNLERWGNSKYESGLLGYYEYAFVSYQYALWDRTCVQNQAPQTTGVDLVTILG